MLFNSQEFRQVVSGNSSKALLRVISKLVFSIKHEKESLYLLRMAEEVAVVLKSHAESPILKFKVAKMLMYLIIMAEGQIVSQLTQEIYPLIRNTCLFNRHHPLITRGMDFFKNNKYYQIATFDQKSKIKNIGCRYIMFCLEFVYVLGEWLPKNTITNSESIFLSSYKMLIKQGVEFPKPTTFTFFSEDRVKQIEKQLKQCQIHAEQLKEEMDEEYFDSRRSKFDAEMMNGVEYLQKKLKQKDEVIAQIKYNNSIIDLQKQSFMTKMKQQEASHGNKIEYYEKKIVMLMQQVRSMKQMLKYQNRKSPEEQNMMKEYISQLQAKIQLLNHQNSQLKEEIVQKSYLIDNMAIKSINQPSSFQKSNVKSQQHIKELLEICDQPQEFQMRRIEPKSNKIQSFFQYRDIKNQLFPCF